MSFQNLRDRLPNKINIVLATVTILLLSIPWVEITSLTLLFAFVPMLILRNRTSHKAFVWYSLLVLTIWHMWTLIWVANATWLGPVAATVTGVTLTIIPMIVYSLSLNRNSKVITYVLFISSWIALEFLYINGEITFPWLVLGNGFALDARIVQWYEYSGALGGSLWILLSNVVIFETINNRTRPYYIWASAIVLLPIIVSEAMYHSYEEEEDPMTVTIVQPNINPYTEKFNSMNTSQQLDIIEALACEAPADVDFIIAPETAIEGNIIEDMLPSNQHIKRLKRDVVEKYDHAEFIIGATIYRMYRDTKTPPTLTARRLNGGGYYDVINGAVQIGRRDSVPHYIKSILVIGVEMMPYPNILKHIPGLAVDLGGSVGGLITQRDRDLFRNDAGMAVGVPICFESIYGVHTAGFVRNGAEVIFIITNDGWWNDTFGYKHHFNYARLRAIECRRSIARSANTGISCFIDQKGDVLEILDWDVRGSLTDDINRNRDLTFYTIYGDVIGRMASFIFVLVLLFLFAANMRKKTNLR